MSATGLHAQLQAALAELKRAEQHAVLLFARIMRHELYRELGYSSIQAYAADSLGFSPSKTSQFVRLAGVLESLPKLRATRKKAREPQAPSSPPYQVVVYTCKECGAAEVVTDRGRKPIDPGPSLGDAQVQTPGAPNRSTIPPARRQEALVRAGHRCEAPGCGWTRFLEVHHRKPRAAGGGNELGNLQVLCSACHRVAHRRQGATGVPSGAISTKSKGLLQVE